MSLTFEPDGRYFFSGSQNGTIERWEADPNLWIKRVCALTESDLTPEEILQFLPDKPAGYQACP